jgi:hypothetical protein
VQGVERTNEDARGEVACRFLSGGNQLVRDRQETPKAILAVHLKLSDEGLMGTRRQRSFTQLAGEHQLRLEPTDDQAGDAWRVFGERANRVALRFLEIELGDECCVEI